MPRRSLIELLDYFRRHGTGEAFIQQRGYRRDVWSYARVLASVFQVARELEARGLVRGDRVLLWGDNSAEWIVAFIACMVRGIVVVPMDRAGAPDFVQRVYAQVGGRLLIHSRGLGPGSLPAVSVETLLQTASRHPITEFCAELKREDVLQIIFTSGTTAEPRGVVSTHGNVLANLEPFETEIAKYLRYERWVHPIRFLNLVPLSHVFGQFMGIWIPPLLGGTVVFPAALQPGETLRTLRRERVSVLVAVPRMVESLQQKIESDVRHAGRYEWFHQQLADSEGEHFLRRWWRFQSVHRQTGWKFWAIVCGGATLPAACEEFWNRLGYVVLQGYGLTETTSLISVNHPFRRGKGSIGKVLPGRELRLGPDGEVQVRGENVAAHYWQSGGLQPVTGDEGWLHTGDLGEIDADGYLHFKGRSKNVIVTAGGMKVHPEDLERALRQQSEVRDCVVLGSDRSGNAEPCAVLLLRDTRDDAEAIVRRANLGLAGYQQIREWHIWPEHDFPRTATQKPRLELVREFVRRQSEHGRTAAPPPQGSLAELVAQVRGAPADGARLDLGSLERVDLICALEERFQVEFNETEFAAVDTLADLEHLIAQPAARHTDYSYPRWAQRWPLTWLRTVVLHLISLPALYLLAAPKITGRENLRDVTGPVLVVSNHITYVDIGFVLAALPFRLRRLAIAMEGERLQAIRTPAAEESFLLRAISPPVYYLITALFNIFPLPKLSGFRESFAYAGASADRGHNILVFPEGRRTPDGAMHPFMTGIGVLATKLALPVVPMRIDGLWEAKQSGHNFAPFHAIRVNIGEAVRYAVDADPAEIALHLFHRVKEL